jgi:hypothetical protein
LATKRKYRTKPQAYRDGGVVTELGRIPDDTASSLKAAAADDSDTERGADELEREAEAIQRAREREGMAPATPSPPIAAPADPNPLLAALHAQQKAEALQRARASEAPAPGHYAYVDRLQVSERKKEFLRANPELLRPDLAPIARRIYQKALADGVPDDSAQIERAVLEGVLHEIGQSRTEPAPAPSPALAPERKRVPMSAPVSRAVTATTGGRDPGSRTLSAEERQIARNSFSDATMSNEEKEYRYLQNRERYKQMKKDGSYSVQQE